MIDQNKNQSRFKILVILGALCTIGPFSIDMYLPAFSEIAKDLHTDVAKVSLSVSSYFIGLAVGQILYGPLLDRFGRRPPLFFGLTLYLLSSLVCMSAKSVELLIAFRFIQAIGGCSAQVASTAMVRDFFPVKDAARIFSALFLMISVSPLIAPSVGSFVVIAMGWQAVFGLLALIVFLITLATYFFLPEGHLPDPSVSFNPKLIFKDMVLIFKHPQFFRYALAGSFSFAGLFVYVTGSPSIFIDTFHLSKKAYGGVFALLSVGFIGGSQFNNFLTRKFSNEKIF
ncbi:MAG: drug resistance transporter, Bcr/CflA subfamily, partial [Bacteriovoracaceae bacterium]|nr:drug resistance transporter, Bcr/CflA subfamily [Bacteriovoracaceae bacterium]